MIEDVSQRGSDPSEGPPIHVPAAAPEAGTLWAPIAGTNAAGAAA